VWSSKNAGIFSSCSSDIWRWDWLGWNTSFASSFSRASKMGSWLTSSAPSWIVVGSASWRRRHQPLFTHSLCFWHYSEHNSLKETGNWSQWRWFIYGRLPKQAPGSWQGAERWAGCVCSVPGRRPVEIYHTKISAGDWPTCPMTGRALADLRPNYLRCVSDAGRREKF